MTLISFATIIGYILGILIVFVLTGILKAPFRWIFSLLLNSITGCFLIYITNMVFAPAGFFIGINPVTAVFMGIFGIPGVVALILLRLLLS